MPVTCPHCSTRYTLPEALLGPGGARVRCPRCREPFSVGPDGGEVVALPSPVPSAAPASNGTTVAVPAAAPAARGAFAARAEHAAYAGPFATDSAAGTGRSQTPSPAIAESPEAPPQLAPREAPAVHAASAMHEAPEPHEVRAAREPAVETPAAIARAVLDDLDSHSGEAIAASRAQGRLFREFGDVIAEAFEFYRRRVGPNADPAPFRAELKSRWGVDLEPGHPARRLS